LAISKPIPEVLNALANVWDLTRDALEEIGPMPNKAEAQKQIEQGQRRNKAKPKRPRKLRAKSQSTTTQWLRSY